MNVQAAQAAFPVSQAMAWFGGHKAALATKLKINAEASVLSMLADFTPVWDSARTAVDTNYYVVEAPARYARKVGYNVDSANINGSTRLLVLKNKRSGNLGAVLMHIHNSTGANSEQVHYMAIPQSFSGNIFYTSLQGAFINGYIYKNGKSILKSSGRAIGAKPAGPQILVARPTDDGCYDITTNWYSQTCYYTATDELRYCDDWRYSFTTVITYCPDPGTGGGGSGGTVAPPAQCPQDTGDDGGNGGDPVTVEAIRGKLIINVAVPGDGDLPGDGGVPPDDPPSNGNYPPPSGYGSTQDSPCAPQILQDSLRKHFPCASKLVIDKLLSDPAYASFVSQFTTAQKPDLKWQDDNLPWSQTAPDGTINYELGKEGADPNSSTNMSRVISLNKSMLQNSSQLLITAAAIHETLHTYIGYNIALATDNVKAGYADYGTWFAALDAFYLVKDLPVNYSNHYQMLDDYFSKAIAILATADNNSHTQKEYVMAMLYGLNTVDENCPADMKTRLDTIFNDKLTQYGITSDDLNTFNTINLNAPSSKRLPTSGC